MVYEVAMYNDISAKNYLLHLLHVYPYDIEQELVLSLLCESSYSCIALLHFLEYFAHFPKFHIITKTYKPTKLSSLYTNMSLTLQTNKSNLHTHLFQFDATIFMKQYKIQNPYAHLPLDQIPFLEKLYLHTIPILPMETSYQPLFIHKSHSFLYRDLSMDAKQFFAVSIHIGDKNGIVYIPKNQFRIGVALASLYEIAPPSSHIDFYILYGLSHQETTYSYYYDQTNDLYIGLMSGFSTLHNFAYLKDMVTTLYNSLSIAKKDLPVHGSMLQLHFHEKTVGLLLIGKNETLKTEMIDALTNLCAQKQIAYTKVFDDNGTLHYLDNDIYATGTQIGTYVSTPGLPPQHVYENLASSVFLKVKKQITHVLLPYTTFDQTCKFHKVDCIIYLNHDNKQQGLQYIHDLIKAKSLFKADNQSSHQEKGQLSFFDYPFGYMLQQELVDPFIDEFLNLMLIHNIKLAVFYTKSRSTTQNTLYIKLANTLLKEILEW